MGTFDVINRRIRSRELFSSRYLFICYQTYCPFQLLVRFLASFEDWWNLFDRLFFVVYDSCSSFICLMVHSLFFFHYISTQAKLSTASLIAPTIQHTNLIDVTLIENWNLHTCRHCKTITHAQANDSPKTLINPSLWVSQCNTQNSIIPISLEICYHTVWHTISCHLFTTIPYYNGWHFKYDLIMPSIGVQTLLYETWFTYWFSYWKSHFYTFIWNFSASSIY